MNYSIPLQKLESVVQQIKHDPKKISDIEITLRLEVIKWLDLNLTGKYNVVGFYNLYTIVPVQVVMQFEKEEDAILFKLTWC
jgi:hypothetical protein